MTTTNDKPEALRLALDALPDSLKAHPGIKALVRTYDAEIQRLTAELEAARKDAERLKGLETAARWFIENPDSPKSAISHIGHALESRHG